MSVGEFVGTSGARSLRDQAGQAGAVVERLGLIENGTREPERLNDLGDGGPLNANAAEHLVLDLHQVARVEELAAQEHGVGHLLGVGVQGALLTQRFGFGVQGLGHEDLRGDRVSCKSNYAATAPICQDAIAADPGQFKQEIRFIKARCCGVFVLMYRQNLLDSCGKISLTRSRPSADGSWMLRLG